MGKYTASYRRCGKCGFISAADPFWLPEAYKSPINRTDLGPVNRMNTNARSAKLIIDLFFRDARRFLDYGAGYGLFVRMMRDLGYDFVGYDRLCESLFAQDFQLSSLSDRKFDVVTAYEVMEHTQAPMQTFEEIFAHADALLFTTNLVPDPPPMPGKWWYYALDHGQHISFFTRQSLQCVASTFGKRLCSVGDTMHLLSSRSVSPRLFNLTTSERLGKFWDLVRPRPSLLGSDWERLRKEYLEKLGIESV